MKKISVFLLGALIIGVASAFTTASKAVPQTAYGFDPIDGWVQVESSDIGVTFDCNSGSNYCLYDQPNGTPLPGETQTKLFELIR
ncbi:MAG: hypothetical protein K2X37_09040 [Chitinophagaceae bacterium]|nr:hypothetical protein [Chitinophagaceae bacterium]